MTFLILPFISERTCVWACMCVAPCAEAEENPHNCFWGQKKQTYGSICYNNRLATLDSSSLKSLFQSCYTSLPLLSISWFFSSELVFKPVSHCAVPQLFYSSFSLVPFHVVTSCTSDLWHLFQLFLFILPSFFPPCPDPIWDSCMFSLLYSSPKSQFGLKTQPCRFWCLVSLLLPFPIPC